MSGSRMFRIKSPPTTTFMKFDRLWAPRFWGFLWRWPVCRARHAVPLLLDPLEPTILAGFHTVFARNIHDVKRVPPP